MPRSSHRLAMLWLIAVLPFTATPAEARRVALIIGNDAYQSLPALEKAAADADGYAELAREKGFDEVIDRTNLTRQQMDFAIAEFLEAIQPGDTAVFVYSGHGWSDGAQNYLVGTDAPKSAPKAVLSRISIPLQNGVNGILDEVARRGASLKVAIIDACRDNPFTAEAGGRSIGIGRGLARVDPPGGTFVVFSAGTGQVALDRLSDGDPSPNGVFTRVFLPLLKKDMPLLDAVKTAQQEVFELARQAQHDQEPAYYDQVRGKACLSATCNDVGNVLLATTPPTAPMDSETLFWSSIASSGNPADYEAYLQQFPGGVFAPLARNRLAALTQPSEPEPPPQPDVASITECDRLAARQANPANPPGVAPVHNYELQLHVDDAITACHDAVRRKPDVARFALQLGRSLAVVNRYEEAKKWFEKGVELDDATSMSDLGALYSCGCGTTQDEAEAMRLFQRGAELGSSDAMAWIGSMYRDGRAGVAADVLEAKKWYEKAVAENNSNAMVLLGALYALGGAIPQDNSETVRLYAKASDLDDPYAMFELAVLYYNGTGVEQDKSQTLRWYKKAAERGNEYAMFQLGKLYVSGDGTSKDAVEARHWYEKAAALNHTGAMDALANLYMNGDGVPQDWYEARRWLQKASDLRDPEAMSSLAILLSKGLGGQQDSQTAANLLLRAMGEGHAETFDLLRTSSNLFDRNVRRTVQQFLINQGYLNDRADGAFGSRTKAALDAYQQALKNNNRS